MGPLEELPTQSAEVELTIHNMLIKRDNPYVTDLIIDGSVLNKTITKCILSNWNLNIYLSGASKDSLQTSAIEMAPINTRFIPLVDYDNFIFHINTREVIRFSKDSSLEALTSHIPFEGMKFGYLIFRTDLSPENINRRGTILELSVKNQVEKSFFTCKNISDFSLYNHNTRSLSHLF